jgi:hypothetical protein
MKKKAATHRKNSVSPKDFDIAKPEHSNIDQIGARYGKEAQAQVMQNADAVSNVQSNYLDALLGFSAQSSDFFRRSVEGFMGVQGNALDVATQSYSAAANYGQTLFQLWYEIFWAWLEAPMATVEQSTKPGKLLEWKTSAELRHRRSRSRAA